MPSDPTGPTPEVVAFALEGVLAPLQSVLAWQWAWRPQGPRLGERHAQSVLRRSARTWDRRRWLGVAGRAPPADETTLREHLGETLRALAGRALPPEEREAVVRRLLHPTGEVERYPDVLPETERLAKAGRRPRAFSSLPDESARWMLQRAGLPPEMLITRAELGSAVLPSKEGYRSLGRILGAEGQRVTVVGALYWSDVRAAHRAGLRGLLVDRTGAWPDVGEGRLQGLGGLETALTALGGKASTAPPDGEPAGATLPSGDFL